VELVRRWGKFPDYIRCAIRAVVQEQDNMAGRGGLTGKRSQAIAYPLSLVTNWNGNHRVTHSPF
jgi:hypothetical protein